VLFSVIRPQRKEVKGVVARQEILSQLGAASEPWDVLVIGGGATGLGAAVEAAARGYRTLLIERSDFAKETSSRSTKLVHGGVRYLEQMNLTLVLDALRERGHMLRNAPHLVHDLSFVVPAYSYFSLPYYGLGLKVYERLSGKLSLGHSELLSRESTLEKLPGINSDHLRGGILYHDGQFDDARYAIALLRTFQDHGGTAINYVEATGLIERNGKIVGIQARDRENDREDDRQDGPVFDLQAKAVINATGVHAEQTIALNGSPRGSLLAISQGSHFVLPRTFLPGSTALMIPKTADGRVLFAIPWHGALLVGTTDVPMTATSPEPRALPEEKKFLRDHIARYLGRAPRPEEILSVWSGLRPLVRKGGVSTTKLSRDHTILVSASGLITVTGGKWTTYRRMGQDTIDHAAQVAALPNRPSPTLELKLHGWTPDPTSANSPWESVYGSDLPALRALSVQSSSANNSSSSGLIAPSMNSQNANLDALLHPRLPFRRREVIWAARYEMARTVEDVLARRTRALFLDARAAIEAAPAVADLLAGELHRCESWRANDLRSFQEIAKDYLYEE
jgi:glycerol-3-phosphate dehydrogenase